MTTKPHAKSFPTGGAAIKAFLAELAASAEALPTTHEQTRRVMGSYSLTGAPRAYLTRQPGPTTLGGIRGEWFIPEACDTARRNLYLHGGGWVAGSPGTHRQLIDAIAVATGRATFAADYRLAPEHPFPAGLDDCADALEAIWKEGPNGPEKADSVAVLGDSAGGNLSAAVTVKALTEQRLPPSQVVLISPVADSRPPVRPALGVDDPVCSAAGIEAVTTAYVRVGHPFDDPFVSPLAASDAIFAQFPPTLIQASSDEYLRDMSVSFARRLWEAGRKATLGLWPDQPHVFQIFTEEIPEAGEAIAQIGRFLR